MEPNQSLLELLKGLSATEILELVAFAKTGNKEGSKLVSANTVKDAEDALDWFIEALKG